jgi:hypothetical protein
VLPHPLHQRRSLSHRLFGCSSVLLSTGRAGKWGTMKLPTGRACNLINLSKNLHERFVIPPYNLPGICKVGTRSFCSPSSVTTLSRSRRLTNTGSPPSGSGVPSGSGIHGCLPHHSDLRYCHYFDMIIVIRSIVFSLLTIEDKDKIAPAAGM